MKVTDKNFLRQLRQKNPQAIEYISAKFNMQPFEKSGMCSVGKCGAPLFFFCKKDYNPEFDSGILKDAEISASLTIL